MKKYRWLQYALHAAVLGGLIFAGMKYISGDGVARALQQFDWRYAPFVCLLSLGYVLVKGERFVRMMRQICDVPKGTLFRAYIAGQACTLLPGGAAARAALLKQVGVPAMGTAAPLALSSLTDQAMFLVCALVAALWYESARKPVFMLLGVLAIISVVLGVEASRTWLMRLIGRFMGRFNWHSKWREFVRSMRHVTTPPLLIGSFVNTGIAFAFLLGALYLSLRGAGVSVPFPAMLLSFALPTMLGRISALPGGVGVTEAGMVGVLDHQPEVTQGAAIAAVTVFRLGTVVFAALVGAVVYLLAWRGHKEAQTSEEVVTEEDVPTNTSAVNTQKVSAA